MLPTTLQSAYALSTDTVSLVYLAGGVGDGLGALIAGFLSDRLHRLRMLRNRDMTRVEYRLEPAFYLSLPFTLSGALLYGWSTQAQVIYYAPMCGYVLCK
jgi:predicted MFS family arabinose efflux permease